MTSYDVQKFILNAPILGIYKDDTIELSTVG